MIVLDLKDALSDWSKYLFRGQIVVGEAVGEYENKRKWSNVINLWKSTIYIIIKSGWK